MQPLSLAFAIPDHPWVDAVDGAAVRIAMTVAVAGASEGRLRIVESEVESGQDEVAVSLRERSGLIHADLRSGANVASAQALQSNRDISCRGFSLHGSGFIVTPAKAAELGLGRIEGLDAHIRPYRNGRDLTDRPRDVLVIDLFGLQAEEVRSRFPEVYQHLVDTVKPERDQNNRKTYRDNWWIHGEPRGAFRPALQGLTRYIATVETAKHRTFQFLDARIAPDNMLVCIAVDDPCALGVLSSLIHVIWALSAGGRLGVGNDPRYNKTRCFEPFPFPALPSLLPPGEGARLRRQDAEANGGATPKGVPQERHVKADEGASHHAQPSPPTPLPMGEGSSARIAQLAEQLDAHRKRQQAAHPELTLTGMYNVLEKLRSGEVLTAKERVIHEHGIVSVLRQLHDDIDAAVLDAYGWADLLPLLRRAMALDPVGGASAADPLLGAMLLSEPEKRIGAQAPPTKVTPAGCPSLEFSAMNRDEARRAFDEVILERLVALNAERAAEEARGLVRWLRPEFQNPEMGNTQHQSEIDTGSEIDTPAATVATFKPAPWPTDPVAQVRAVADALSASPIPLSVDELAARFSARGAWKKRLPQLLEMLVTLGRAQESGGSYSAR